ncbi:MAG TPA: hypothetical protein VFV35_02485 [Acidimicrobiales bacterium]|nr:hypothetical protein [Acidimicrobiales bacterium]
MIERLADLVAERAGAQGTALMVGIAGGVGVGKTTLAAALAGALQARDLDALVLATDGFLFPNEELARRGLLMQKGFPASYDVAALRRAVETLRRREPAEVPVYDHLTYDVLGAPLRVEPADVVLLEGVNALQPDVADLCDLSVFVDVDNGDARRWFVERFAELCETGEGFYAAFAAMTAAERREVAEAAWSGINLVNLETHILPTRDRADVVVRKARDHSIVDVRTR